jgi:MFS family permease
MIADETSGKDRAKGFGILGAMFGMGFLIGPAIGGLMSSISLSAPFWLASFLALGTTILGVFILRETLDKTEIKKVKSEPLFNFRSMISALFSPVIGSALLLTFISYFAQQAVIIGFQTFTVDQLRLDATTIGLIFAAIGVVVVFMNMIGLKFVIEKVKSNRKIVTTSFISASILIMITSFTKTTPTFVFSMLIYIVSFSLINPVLTSFISKRVNKEDQGIILGINQSYASLGQIFGPISAGLISQINTASIFRWGSLLLFVGFLFSSKLGKPAKKTNL